MTIILMLLYECAPTVGALVLFAVVLHCLLRLFFKWLHVPNFTSASPSGILTWKKLAPPDILFRLAALAGFTAALYWFPIYYWTTYESSGDERDGGVLTFSFVLSPIFWIVGLYCYLQIWRIRQPIRHRAAFYLASTLLLFVVLSNFVPLFRLYAFLFRPDPFLK